jgi:signal transduction histidine kinase
MAIAMHTAIQTLPDRVKQTQCPEPSRRVAVRDGPHAHAPRSLLRSDHRTAKQESAATAATLQERARIARELHDSVSQTLYAITLTAARALSLLKQNERSEAPLIEDVLRLASTGQAELRALLMNMRHDRFASAGLTEGLNGLVADVRARSGLDIRLSVGDEPDVPAATTEALLLISREALHNVVRHASADRVEIVLEVDPRAIVLLVTDDGRGFDPAASRPGHFGLQSMRERAAAVGGTLDVVSTHDIGTRVRICIPQRVQRHG